jgi:Acetyltransferase (GNAT) domain
MGRSKLCWKANRRILKLSNPGSAPLSNFDRKRRKEFKRLRARLGEQGKLTAESLQIGQSSAGFVKEFLNLESSGWKGKKGTAIKAMPKLAEALHEAAEALHQMGKLRFWSLKLDGQTLATMFSIVEGPKAWLGKITYDESFAKYSPGVMLILDCTKSIFAEPQIQLVDSSAVPHHPMIDHIWRDRIAMVDILVAPATFSKSHFNRIATIEKLRRGLRGFARDAYYKLRGAQRS